MALYEPAVDKGQPTHFDIVDGVTRTAKMTWYIIIGEDLKRDRDERFSFWRRFPRDHSPDDLVFQDKLWMSEIQPPPLHPTSDVKLNCILKSDLRTVDTSLFQEILGLDGQEYVEITYDLVISTKEAAMKFWLEFGGKEAGGISVMYE